MGSMAKTKATFYAQKIEGEPFRFEKPDELDEFKENAPPGRYSLEYRREKNRKTQKQCAVIFALMIQQTIVQANDLAIGIDDLLVHLIDGNIPKGVGITQDFLHELMYVICPTTDKDGRRITLSKMNTEQANNLFERFRLLMAPLGIDIPDPDPAWRENNT